MDKPSVLLVEDDAFLARIYAQKFEEASYDVHLVGTGEDGLKMAGRDKPSIIVLDILLPGIDGFEVLEKLKQDPATQGIPVVVLSNLGQKEDVDKATSLGAVGYLIKAHALPQDLLHKANEVLGRA